VGWGTGEMETNSNKCKAFMEFSAAISINRLFLLCFFLFGKECVLIARDVISGVFLLSLAWPEP
jgi:hypothetical protein